MDDRLIVRRSDPIRETEHGTLNVRLVPWDTVARVNDYGRHYSESWRPGSLTPSDRVIAYDQHESTPDGVVHGRPIGRVDNIEARDDGLYGDIVLSGSRLAADARADVACFGGHVSIEAMVPDDEIGTDVARERGVLTGVALVLPPHQPAYPSAEVLAVRSTPTMPTTLDPTDPTSSPAPSAPSSAEPAAAPLEVARTMVRDEISQALAGFQLPAAAGSTHPLAAFASYPEFVAVMRTASADRVAELDAALMTEWDRFQTGRSIARALADQTLAASPGLQAPQWLTEVFAIVDLGRRLTNALGGTRSLTSLDVHYPTFGGDIKTLVGVQAAEKTAISTGPIVFGRGDGVAETLAFGSDISVQASFFSTPGYVEQYNRVVTAAMNWAVESKVATALDTLGTGTVGYDAADADPSGELLRGALLEGSVAVEDATGTPASVVAAATDMFIRIGSKAGIYPANYGTSNVTGTVSAASLDLNISGLQVVRAPALPAGKIIMTNGTAAGVFEHGVHSAQAPNVEKLGTDVAMFTFIHPAVFVPAGVVSLEFAAGRSGASKKS